MMRQQVGCNRLSCFLDFGKRINNMATQKWFTDVWIPAPSREIGCVFFRMYFSLPPFLLDLAVFFQSPQKQINECRTQSIPSLTLTAKAPEKMEGTKRKGSSSNHPFSRAFAVSFREGNTVDGSEIKQPPGMYNKTLFFDGINYTYTLVSPNFRPKKGGPHHSP